MSMNAVIEGGKDDDLLARSDHVLNALGYGVVLGFMERDAQLRQAGQKLSVVGFSWVSSLIPVEESLHGP